jgi:hypothetical protein
MIGHSLLTLEKMPYNPTMPNNRLIPVLAFGLIIPIAAFAQAPGGATVNPSPTGNLPGAAAPANVPGGVQIPGMGATAPAKEEPPTPAEDFLDKAIARIKKISSFSADIAQTVDMLNQKFEIGGKYLKAPNFRISLQLKVTGLGDTEATTLQVCDGTTLWELRQVLDTVSYTKLTLPAVLKKLNDPVLAGGPIYETVINRIGFTGPEAMLSGLRRTVKFDQKAEQTLDGKKVVVIRGQWKDRTGLVGPNQQAISPTTPLPPYIPSNVAIWIGVEDGWPLKIEMVGNAPSMLAFDNRTTGLDGSKIGAKKAAPKVEPSRIVLQYKNLQLNPKIEDSLFAHTPPPGTTNIQDETQALLDFLDAAIQQETIRKKAEDAKGTPATLPGIDLPKPEVGAVPQPSPAPTPGPDAPSLPKK